MAMRVFSSVLWGSSLNRVIRTTMILLFLVSCTREGNYSASEVASRGEELIFTAESGEVQTKTAFQADETSIWWSPRDQICIFYGDSEGSQFTATNDTETAKAVFTGTLNAFTGEAEVGVAHSFWAIYPYSSAISCDGSSIVASLSNHQVAKAGSFAPNTNISIAKSSGMNLSFFNACSWFRFSVQQEGITSVTFRGNNGEIVAGEFSVSMGEDGRPTVPSIVEGKGKTEIVLSAPIGKTLEVGKYYYITLFPQIFEKGFTVTFETNSLIGSRSIERSATYLRSKYNTGTLFDKTINYTAKINPSIHQYSIGDIVEADGVGIVAGVNDEGYILLLSVTELRDMDWGTSYDWCCAYGDSWSMPTIDELTYISQGFYQINECLSAAGYVTLSLRINKYYWSCSNNPSNSDYYYKERLFDGNINTNMGEDEKKTATVNYTRAVKLIHSPMELAVGDKTTLSASLILGNTYIDNLTWASSDEGVATVNSSGVVTALSPGCVTIKALIGSRAGLSCELTVLRPIESISFEKSEIDIFVRDEPTTLAATILPENAGNRLLIWESSDANIATVDQNGQVSAIFPGTAIISVKSANRTKIKASCTVNVKQHVECVSLNKTVFSLREDSTEKLVAMVFPVSATDQTIVWISSNSDIATVNQNGLVSGISEGTAQITAVSNDNNEVQAKCLVNVYYDRVESISLDKTHIYLYPGHTSLLEVTILPETAKNKSVTWSSNNTNIATVNQDGLVTGISIGSAAITATSQENGLTAECEVTVNAIPDGAVDLGLSVLWASCNLGANAPEEYGKYYQWGETSSSTKAYCKWANYKWCDGSEKTLTKYNTQSSHGTVDNKTILDIEDDAANAVLGGSWRIPTKKEYEELVKKCTWKWTTVNDVKGYLIKSKVSGYQDKSIFLPAAGFIAAGTLASDNHIGDRGYYWTSELYDTKTPSNANSENFTSSKSSSAASSRKDGLTIRPVTD